MPAAPVAGLINNAIADPWTKLRPSRALCLALSVASGTAVKYLQVCRHSAMILDYKKATSKELRC